MEFALIIYAIDLLGKFSSLIFGLLITFGSLMAIIFIIFLGEFNNEKYIKPLKTTALALTVCTALFVITPSKQTAYMMLGAYAAQKTVESSIGQDILKIIEMKIKEEINEETKKVMK